MNNHIKIYTDSAIVINRAADLLNQKGIPSIIKNNVESARLAGFGTTNDNVDLWIEEAHKEKAQAILADF